MHEKDLTEKHVAHSNGSFKDKQALWFGFLFIAVSTMVAYSPVYSAGFIWDDNDHVIRLAGFANGLKQIWLEPGSTIQYYPLVFTAFWLQIKLWGLNATGFHIINVVLHAVNAILFWLCLRRLKIPGAFCGACIFALHPLHVESVAWITELKNVLSALFYQLAFFSYWRFAGAGTETAEASRKNWPYYAAALVFFACALLSKTVTCTLPPVILLLIWWKRGRIELREWVRLIPFFALAVVLGLLTMRVEADMLLAKGAEWAFSPVERLLIAGRATWFHVWKLVWPHPLMFNYPRWRVDTGLWWQYLFPLSVVGMLFLLWRHRERIGRGPLVACLFVIGTNFPVLGFLNVYSFRFSFVADHYYYIANFGVIALICAGLSRLGQRLPRGLQPAMPAAVVGVTVALGVLTWQQGRIYYDNLTLFTDIISKNPASWFAYSNRGGEYTKLGRDDLALSDLNNSLAIKPDEADALHSRGVIYLKQKRLNEAFADFDRSIAIRPWRTDYLRNRCLAYRFASRFSAALVDADQLLKREPDNPENYLLRASISLQQQSYPAALADVNTALSLDPEDADALANRGLIYLRQNLNAKAVADFSAALALRPESAAVLYNRGIAHAATGNRARAAVDLQQARQLGYPVSDDEMRGIVVAK